MGLLDQLTHCKGCGEADPTQDTVKVNPALFTGEKENMEPRSAIPPHAKSVNQKELVQRLSDEEEARKVQEQMRRQAEQEESRRQAEERRRVEEEARKQRREEADRAAAQELARKAAEKAAEEQKRIERERAAREAAEATQAAHAAEEARIRKEEDDFQEAQAKVNQWLFPNGFADTNVQKKKLLGGWKFPLHTAVKQNDLEMVKALVLCGADKSAKDSKGQTPYDFALKKDSDGSMKGILLALA